MPPEPESEPETPAATPDSPPASPPPAPDLPVSDAPVEPPAPAGPPPLAELEGVTRSYGGAPALGPIDLRLEGSCVALLGPNGAGKTTMVRLLMGLLRPDAGRVRVLGKPVQGFDVRRLIGYVPEGDAQFPQLTGIQAVAYSGRLQGMGAADSLQRAHQVLDYVGLRDERYRRAASYSSGMRQRLKIAQALVHDPSLLILDEPTEGVDPQARDAILQLVQELTSRHGIQVLLCTHLLADVERLATHAVVLSAGHVVAHGTLESLRARASPAFLVRVAGDAGALTRRLDEQGIPWRPAHPAIEVQLPDAAAVLREVAAAGLVARHLSPARLKLEEAFAQAVGGQPGGAGAA